MRTHSRGRTNKRYRVIVRPKAAEDLDAIHLFIARRAPMDADRFLDKLNEAIEGLTRIPERCVVARESEAFDFVIRQRLLDRYRILYTIEGRKVRILRVRPSSQMPLSPSEDPLTN